jgi:hypothetical protein
MARQCSIAGQGVFECATRCAPIRGSGEGWIGKAARLEMHRQTGDADRGYRPETK